MKDINYFTFTGHLVRNPELRFTLAGKAVATFQVSNRQAIENQATEKEITQIFQVVAWDELGKRCAEELTKGDQIWIVGTIQVSEENKRRGLLDHIFQVIASDFQMLYKQG